MKEKEKKKNDTPFEPFARGRDKRMATTTQHINEPQFLFCNDVGRRTTCGAARREQTRQVVIAGTASNRESSGLPARNPKEIQTIRAPNDLAAFIISRHSSALKGGPLFFTACT